MKKILSFIVIVLMAGFVGLGYTFTRQPLPVREDSPIVIPPANPPSGMNIIAIPSGQVFSRAALAYQGGDFGEERTFSVGAILVQHPKGMLLFDSGFSSHVDEHVKTAPWLVQKTTRYQKGSPVAEQLAAHGISLNAIQGIYLTHSHWDHVGGVADLPGIPVWVSKKESEFIASGHRSIALARQLGGERFQAYTFQDPPYLGFPASFDVFKDGSVVLVPAPSHTPGSMIAFVNVSATRRYALVGDLVWQMEGIEIPAEKPWISRQVSDAEPDSARGIITHMYRIKKAMPELVIVPAHDQRVWSQLPKLTNPKQPG